jgi:hypothetical protein
MHVVADRPTIVSALPALTSTCMRRKTHNACWRISCNTEVRVLEQAGAEAEAENRRAAPRAANHALASGGLSLACVRVLANVVAVEALRRRPRGWIRADQRISPGDVFLR